jgi:hypothetical protein
MLRDEQLANQIGMIEQKNLLRPDMKLRGVAVLARDAREERDRIALNRAQVTEGITLRGPGGVDLVKVILGQRSHEPLRKPFFLRLAAMRKRRSVEHSARPLIALFHSITPDT